MKPIPIRNSAQMVNLHQHGGLKVKEVVKLFTFYSQASIYRHGKRHIGPSDPVDKCRFNKRRASKITKQVRHSVTPSLKKFRENEGSFTSTRIALDSGVEQKVEVLKNEEVLKKYTELWDGIKSEIGLKKGECNSIEYIKDFIKIKFNTDYR